MEVTEGDKVSTGKGSNWHELVVRAHPLWMAAKPIQGLKLSTSVGLLACVWEDTAIRLSAWCFSAYQSHGREKPAIASLPGDKAMGQPISDDCTAQCFLLLLDSLRIRGMRLAI